MTDEEAYNKRLKIVNYVEALVEDGWYTLEEILAEIEDQLVHLVPE